MKRLTITTLFVFLLLVPFALASGTIETNNFFEAGTNNPVTNVDSIIFQCADTDDTCTTVIQPAIAQENSGTTNTFTFQRLGTPNPTDYAKYYYHEDYLPQAFVLMNDFEVQSPKTFNRFFEKGEACTAPVQNLIVQNAVNVNEPLQVSVDVATDATTHSAFSDPGVPPFFIPQGFDDHYSALTEVTLTVTDANGNVVHTQTKTVNLFQDTAQQVTFDTFTPQNPGIHEIEVTSRVVDSQCNQDTDVPSIASKMTNVLAGPALNQCFTLLNNLASNTPDIFENDEVTFTYEKISNHVDGLGVATAVPMLEQIILIEGQIAPDNTFLSSQIVTDFTQTIAATDPNSPSTQNFQLSLEETGVHTIIVQGFANSALCSGLANQGEMLAFEFNVKESPLNDIHFTVMDLDNNPVPDAIIAVVSNVVTTQVTDNEGKTTFTNFAPGNYDFSIIKQGFELFKGSVDVGLDDRFFNVHLTAVQQNLPPVADAGDDQDHTTTDQVVAVDVTLDASDSFDVDGSIDEFLWFFGDGTSAVGEVVTHTYTAAIEFTAVLRVTDNDGLTDTDEVDIKIKQAIANQAPDANLTCPATGIVGELLTIDATGSSDDSAIDEFSYEFGDGTTAPDAGSLVQKVYNTAGTFVTTLTVTDDEGLTDQDSCTITINNPSNGVPTADAGPDQTVVDLNNDGVEQVTLDGSSSSDSDGAIVDFTWRNANDQSLIANGEVVDIAFFGTGTVEIELTVTDDQGATDTDTFTLTIIPDNFAPVADAGNDKTELVNTQVIFDGTSSSDSDGTIVDSNWDFGDGNSAQGLQVQHVYQQTGTFTAILTVVDDDGAIDTDAITVTVNQPNNQAPTADAGLDIVTVDSDNDGSEIINLDGSNSFDTDGTIVDFEWNVGGTIVNGENVNVLVPVGTVTATLTVTDDDGATDTDTVTIQVDPGQAQNIPPTADAGLDILAIDQDNDGSEQVDLDGSNSFDTDGTIVDFTWRDLTTQFTISGETVSVNFPVGIHTMELTVTDDQGATGTDFVDIEVAPQANTAPQIVSTPPTQGEVDRLYVYPVSVVDQQGGTLTFSLPTSPTGMDIESFENAFDDTRVDRLEGELEVGEQLLLTSLNGQQFNVVLQELTANTCTFIVNGESTGPLQFTDVAELDDGGVLLTVEDVDPTDCAFSLDKTGLEVDLGPTDDFVSATDFGLTLIRDRIFDGDGATYLSVTGIEYDVTIDDIDPVNDICEIEVSATRDSTNFFDSFSLGEHDEERFTIEDVEVIFGVEQVSNECSIFIMEADGINAYVHWVPETNQVGTNDVSLEVSDGNLEDTQDFSILVGIPVNLAPNADAGNSRTVNFGDTITFDGSNSNDPDGTIATFSWDFGDGFSALGEIVQHVFSTIGTFIVELTVTDDDGATATDQITINVNGTPTAQLTCPLSSVVNEEVRIDASQSSDNGQIVTYQFDFGDGTSVSTPNAIVTHNYTQPNQYQVQVTVIDDDGLTSSTSCIINVFSAPEVVEDNTPNERLVFSKIQFNEFSNAGELLDITTTLYNDGRQEMDDITITASIYELNVRSRIGPFDVDDHESNRVRLLLDIPEDASGDYDIQFIASNDDMRRVTYRAVTIE